MEIPASDIGFTTFRFRDVWDDSARVVAAFVRDGRCDNGEEAFLAQFAYCSPMEKQSNKNIGRFIASKRLVASGERGGIPFGMPEGFKPKDFRDQLRNMIVAEAKRKGINWFFGYCDGPEDLI